MVPAVGEDRDWTQPRADEARRRYRKRNTRLAAEREEHARRVEESRRHLAPDDRKRALIQAAMERASERLKAAQRADAGAARKENT
jgi:small-conductance mechanosensitive channel